MTVQCISGRSVVYSEEVRRWASRFERCWSCGKEAVWGCGLDVHHFVRGGARRENDTSTTAMLCVLCHDDLHRGRWNPSVALMLALKMVNDPEHYDRERVNRLRGRARDAVSEAEVALEVSRLFKRRY